jgi:hypothetical protein
MPIIVTKDTMGDDGPLAPGDVVPDRRFAAQLVLRGRAIDVVDGEALPRDEARVVPSVDGKPAAKRLR